MTDTNTTDLQNEVNITKNEILKELQKVIVGQEELVDLTLQCIFCHNHALLMGVRGLAKTLLVETIAKVVGIKSSRIQFTPDLMPSDIIGAEILDESRNFKFIKGPLFSNIILADEINRTPPKTQAALLEAMQEKQVTAAGVQHKLDAPFFVLATQNPIEQEGTYPLPEAQLDRFLMHLEIDYPDAVSELAILKLNRGEALQHKKESKKPVKAISQSDIFAARDQVMEIHMPPAKEN